ncbi:MAG TPA: hypothetical protein VF486_03565 [Actinomycetes bacterium]
MWVILVCAALVLAGLAAVIRWGGLPVEPPPAPARPEGDPTEPPPVSLVVRRYLWYLVVTMASGAVAGILAAGAGGRLVMRLLAVTAGAGAQGRITEAEEIVGRITIGGTIAFVVFTGLFLGLPSAAGYLLLRRWLPAGRAAGLAYGALLLVVAGTRLEPLRRGNPDFDLVGPGWLAVAAFTALVVFHGMLVAALAGRLSRAVPLLAARPGPIAIHLPLLLLVLPGPALASVLVLIGVAVVLLSRIPSMLAAWRSRPVLPAGRVVLAAAALVAFPGFASSVVDIVSRP